MPGTEVQRLHRSLVEIDDREASESQARQLVRPRPLSIRAAMGHDGRHVLEHPRVGGATAHDPGDAAHYWLTFAELPAPDELGQRLSVPGSTRPVRRGYRPTFPQAAGL